MKPATFTIFEPLVSATDRKLDSFRSLPRGWHYGKGGPISDEVLNSVRDLHELMLMIGLSRTNAFASEDGGVLLTAYYREHYIALDVSAERQVSCTYEFDGEEVDSNENVEIERAKRWLVETVKTNIWSSSDSYTPVTMIMTETSSTTWPSKNHPAGAGCLYSSENARHAQAA